VIVGLERADDAGVYRISEDLAIIQTVDFFTPVVDDPYWFGQIAAANALSDVYAMGGVPKTAMNLVAFPLGRLEIGILRRVLEGGLDKMREAGVVLIGGHSVEDDELKYGLAVTGFIHPGKVLTKNGFEAGDRLILTKALGTGIVNTAIKGGLASVEVTARVTRMMAALNRDAAHIMARYPVHACTDITGFGLLGHMAEMVTGSSKGVELAAAQIPVIPQAVDYAAMGLVPGGTFKNKEFRSHMVAFGSAISAVMQDILFDPQTSGGLLICVEASAAEDLAAELVAGGIEHAAVIGRVGGEGQERIVVE